MRFMNHVSYISIDFLREESGASLAEHLLVFSLVAVVFTLCLLALKKDS